jgi:excisionase family DNA binding protein
MSARQAIIEPLAVSPKEAAAALSVTSRCVYSLIAEGKLIARKLGSRTIIDYAVLKAYHSSLPPKTPGALFPNSPQAVAPRRRTRKEVRR